MGGRISVSPTAANDGITRWLGILINEECQVIVNAKWEGMLDEGPKLVIGRLRELAATETPLIDEEIGSPSTKVSEASNVLLGSSTKTSKQHVWMYGYPEAGIN